MNEIEGVRSDLIDRLVELLNSDALGEGGWYDVTSFAVFFIGGAALDKVTPDTGKAPAPGTVGERTRQLHKLISRENYLELIRDRLRELVMTGVEEAFLVRSVRDAIRETLAHMADVGAGDRNRAEVRNHLLRAAEDPAEIARVRAQRAESDPSAEALCDDEVAASLREAAENPALGPTSAESAADRWSMLAHWDEQVALLLPDAIFDKWRLQLARKPGP